MAATSFPSIFPLLLSAAPAAGQWSSDPAASLVVADGPGDQVQAKIAVTSDGGCYVSWFDSLGNGFDVRLQRLDAQGNELWAPNGVLVADRGFSSTQDYGLAVDATGAAVLAYRDDSTGSTQIAAQRVSSAGSLSWGATGVLLTNSSGFLSAPKVAGTGDGEVTVAWGDNGAVHLQRLTTGGTPVWSTDLDLAPGAGLFFVSDLRASADDVVLSLVHQTGTQIFTPKHLLAQKIDPGGAFLWGSAPVSVFDGGSLQIGNFPSFQVDGSGGAVFAWYGVSPLQSYAQRILADGTEAFPHNGVAGSTDPGQLRVSPHVTFDSVTSETYFFWTELNSSQSLRGVSGQKLDASGARRWGATGKVVVPLASDDVGFLQTQLTGSGAYVAWLTSSGFGNDTGQAAILDTDSSIAVGPFPFASTPSGKGRLTSARSSATGDFLLAWTDDRVDAGDVLAQNIRSDGGLGGVTPFLPYCFGEDCPCGNEDDQAGCSNSTGSGALLELAGSASVSTDDLVALLTGMDGFQPALLFFGDQSVSGGAGLPFGDGLRCAGGQVVRVGVAVANGSGSAGWGPGLGSLIGWSVGDTIYFQAWYRDPSGSPCGNVFNLSNGVSTTLVP